MTVNAPWNSEIKKELETMIEDVLVSYGEQEVNFNEDVYYVILDRELELEEKDALEKTMNTLMEGSEFSNAPLFLKCIITETDRDILELLEIEKGQEFIYHFSEAAPGIISYTIDERTYYETGVILNISDDVANLEYEYEVPLKKENVYKGLLDTLEAMGPMSAGFDLFLSDGSKDIFLGNVLEEVGNEYFIYVDSLGYSDYDPYDFFGEGPDVWSWQKDFLEETGYSNTFIKGLFYPNLTASVESYELP